jgi:anti-sigma regulatory factor (Ser/Thr protein kinase)
MLAVRLRVFAEWHRGHGRKVVLDPPTDARTKRAFSAMAIDADQPPEDQESDAILPVTYLEDANTVEDVAERTREILEYQLHDVSPLGQAAFMAVSELCGNAIEHGENPFGAYAAVSRISEPRRQVSIAICDLGIGIPEHIRQRFPEWGEDGYAIAHATKEFVSGTGNPHRGIGFSEVFEAALTSELHGARMDIHSANGFFRLQVVQEQRKPEVFPAARFKRGTWISYDLVSV